MTSAFRYPGLWQMPMLSCLTRREERGKKDKNCLWLNDEMPNDFGYSKVYLSTAFWWNWQFTNDNDFLPCALVLHSLIRHHLNTTVRHSFCLKLLEDESTTKPKMADSWLLCTFGNFQLYLYSLLLSLILFFCCT